MDTGQSDFTDPPSAVKYVIGSSDVISATPAARNRRSVASGHGILGTVAVCSRGAGGRREKGGLAAIDHISDTVPGRSVAGSS